MSKAWSLSNIKIPCYDTKEYNLHEQCKNCILKRGCEENTISQLLPNKFESLRKQASAD